MRKHSISVCMPKQYPLVDIWHVDTAKEKPQQDNETKMQEQNENQKFRKTGSVQNSGHEETYDDQHQAEDTI